MNDIVYWLFDTPKMRRFLDVYEGFFSIREYSKSPALLWVFGATLFSYYITFYSHINSKALSIPAALKGNTACWPYFQSCSDYYFFYNLPYGYSQNLWYMALFGLLLLVIYFLHKKEWILAHMLLVVPYVWHTLTTFVLTSLLAGNFDYYLFCFATVLLFFPHKEYFLKLLVVLFYFLSTITKTHEAWVLGGYFDAMMYGLPFFPEWSTIILTNQLIFMEMIGAWFLLSKRVWLQRIVTAYFIFFHLYSGILVGYRYPTIVLPTLVILFAMFYRYQDLPMDRKSIAGWVFVAILCVIQSLGYFIPGDQKFTLEGNRFGLYMFESNHQCVSTEVFHYTDGRLETRVRQSSSARNRCDPFEYMQYIRNLCKQPERKIASVVWTFDHSINGHPFRRQVDVQNACTLTYAPLSHNEWIRFEDDAPIIGYPVENWYY